MCGVQVDVLKHPRGADFSLTLAAHNVFLIQLGAVVPFLAKQGLGCVSSTGGR